MQAWTPEQWPVQDWQTTLNQWLDSPAGRDLGAFLTERLAQGCSIYPPNPFRALQETALRDVKVVILGQDPYHGPGQAQGLAFSVAPGCKLPPSLRNIFKELVREDLLGQIPANGSLLPWARNGVLLLNTCLTVEDGQPASHAKRGWEVLTNDLLALIASSRPACVYLLWGVHAQTKRELIEQNSAAAGTACKILQSNHPSPLSAQRPPVPFLGNNHFTAARDWLSEKGVALNWTL